MHLHGIELCLVQEWHCLSGAYPCFSAEDLTLARSSPNSSSFFFSGESSSSLSAAVIWAWILPISVLMPMSFTMPRQLPLEMAVPANRHALLGLYRGYVSV